VSVGVMDKGIRARRQQAVGLVVAVLDRLSVVVARAAVAAGQVGVFHCLAIRPGGQSVDTYFLDQLARGIIGVAFDARVVFHVFPGQDAVSAGVVPLGPARHGFAGGVGVRQLDGPAVGVVLPDPLDPVGVGHGGQAAFGVVSKGDRLVVAI